MDWMLDVLKESAEKFGPQLVNKARDELRGFSERDLMLFNYIFREYYETVVLGRWYDPCHVAYSTFFAVGLVRAGDASPLVVPAIILHDIGYYSQLVDKENWASKDSRIIHMQEGAGMAAEILATIAGFSATEIGKIVGMVASHDNGYLSILTKDMYRLALRDADRAWVMHPLSFYKDWFSKKKKREELSLLDLFQSRLSSFYGPDEVFPAEWGRINNLDKEDAVQSPPFTKFAKEWRDRQFTARFREIDNNITRDIGTFLRSVQKYIRSELKVG